LPPPVAAAASRAVSGDGRTAVVLIVPRESPESDRSQELVRVLRAENASNAAGVTQLVGGGTALLHDFDGEMFSSLGRVVLAVVLLTFALLFLFFRSVTVPVKAIVANLLSVVSAYGFLVLVFQDGHGARALGITAPGGLNSF